MTKLKVISSALTCLLVLSYSVSLLAQLPSFRSGSYQFGIEDIADFSDQYGNGAAAADYDQDGDIDFYLTTDQGINDRLYQNDGSGFFTNVAETAGITALQANRAALWFDYNGDHLLDLVLAGESCVNRICEEPVLLTLYQQQADHTFLEVSEQAGLIIDNAFDSIPFFAIGGLAAADINQDNYLDLLLTVWGGGLKLFLNNTEGGFEDITPFADLFLFQRTPWQPMFYDFNRDGLIDIYCNIDFDDNRLWLNLGGGNFEDKTREFGLQTAFNEMGIAISDFDNDGDLDLYLTNISRDFQGIQQHNVLFEQKNHNGTVEFKEVAVSQGVDQSGWDWGTSFIDINNDGRQDLLTTNGWWNGLDWGADTSHLWLNTLGGFIDVSQDCGFDDGLSATTLIGFDKDRDGDMDVLQTLKDNEETQQPLIIYENNLEELPYPQNYLVVRPRMDGTNHYAIGSELTLVADNLISTRLISAGCSFYGQEPAEAFFGLAEQEEIQEIKIRWPNSDVSIYRNIPVNQVIELEYAYLEPPTELELIHEDEAMELSWIDNSDNESGFIVYRALDSTFLDLGNMITIELPANTTSFVDSSFHAGPTYYYRVRAQKENLLSDNSNEVRISTVSAPVFPGEIKTVLFPNPIRAEELGIRMSNAYVGPVIFCLFDMKGREVWTAQTDKMSPTTEYQYSLSVTGGVYNLLIQLGDVQEYHQLIVINQ